MKTTFKKLTPNLMVTDVVKSVDFYIDTLGFQLDMAVPENEEVIENELLPDKKYIYAMVHRDEVFVMFMRKDIYTEDLPVLKDKSIGASASLYIDITDVEEFYNKIKERVEIVKKLATTWYGMTEFYIYDNNGYILGFAEQKK